MHDVKVLANEFNFCTDNKIYKQNPDLYNGNTADFCTILRICITHKTNTPDLFTICHTLGKDELLSRVNKLKEILN